MSIGSTDLGPCDANLISIPARPQTTYELVEISRSRHGYAYILFGDRLLRGRDPQVPDLEWCSSTRSWKANVGGGVPDDVWVKLLTEPEAERLMWPEFYGWADQWL